MRVLCGEVEDDRHPHAKLVDMDSAKSIASPFVISLSELTWLVAGVTKIWSSLHLVPLCVLLSVSCKCVDMIPTFLHFPWLSLPLKLRFLLTELIPNMLHDTILLDWCCLKVELMVKVFTLSFDNSSTSQPQLTVDTYWHYSRNTILHLLYPRIELPSNTFDVIDVLLLRCCRPRAAKFISPMHPPFHSLTFNPANSSEPLYWSLMTRLNATLS